jgi:small ligand-binding sensory domain FIST
VNHKRYLPLLALACCSSIAQEIRLSDGHASAAKGHVLLLSDSVAVEARKSTLVELRFQVQQGFHINSHTPKDELLIPTVLKLDPTGPVKIIAEVYQPGAPFRLQVGDGETLDVYQNDFHITVRIIAPKGPSTLLGSLRYQACDNAACFPPKTLPITIAVTGK